MARGGKRSTSFKPGQTGNPNGRPPVPLDLKEARSVNKMEFDRVLNKYMYLAVPDIDTAMKSRELPMIEMIVAKIVAKAFNEGDQRRLEFIIDRLIGKASFEAPPPLAPTAFEISQKVSFSEYCKAAGYPSPYEPQIAMLDFAMNSHDPRLLLGSRGYGKTDYVTVLGVGYDIYLNGVETSNLIISKSKTRNTALIEEIANSLEANGVELDKSNASCVRVKGMVGKDHSAEVLTIKSSFRGRHPYRILMDDPVTEEDVSPAMRKTVKRKYDEAYKLCKNILIIGQPAHADDLYAELRPILKKMEIPHGTIKELDADLTAMLAAGVDPVSIEMSYHLRVPVEGSMPFAKIKYIDQYPVSDSVAFIDPSDGGDYTAVSVVRGLMDGVAVKGKVWKRAWYHCTDEMIALFKATKVTRVCFETNCTGTQPIAQLQQLLGPMGIGVVGKHSDSNKHAVIMAAGSYSNLIHLSRDSDKTYIDHVVKYEYGVEFDDAPDSLARCLEWIGLIKGKSARGK